MAQRSAISTTCWRVCLANMNRRVEICHNHRVVYEFCNLLDFLSGFAALIDTRGLLGGQIFGVCMCLIFVAFYVVENVSSLSCQEDSQNEAYVVEEVDGGLRGRWSKIIFDRRSENKVLLFAGYILNFIRI